MKNKRKLSKFLDSVVLKYRKNIKQIHLSYIFCTDENLLSLNQQYLDHDTYTDIITFDLSETPEILVLGEVYISIDRVRENAGKYNVPYDEELLRVIVHGALHLCGFKDKTTSEKQIMRQHENSCINEFQDILATGL